jgi:hypothetical protein
MKSIKLPEPHTKLYSLQDVNGTIARVEHTVAPFFMVAETVKLMKLYADACVGKKLIDMGYKDYVAGDPEDELAEIHMLSWFMENEE